MITWILSAWLPELFTPKSFGAPDFESVVYSGALTVDSAHIATNPIDFADGVGGCTMRGTVLLVGETHYIYWLRLMDTPTGVVPTGLDPGDFPVEYPECVGRTGVVVELPQTTYVTAEAHAALVAAALLTIDFIVSAVPRVSGNSNLTWTIDIEIRDAVLAVGTRGWADAGLRGLHGSHVYRLTRGGEAFIATSSNVTFPGASAIAAPPSRAIIWCVQATLGTTVNTGTTNRIRMSLRHDTSADGDPAGSTVVFDFGQIPASEIIAERNATIYLTPAQCLALYNAHNALSGGRYWLSVHASGSCHVVSYPSGTGIQQGEMINTDSRFHNATIDGDDPPAASWVSGATAAIYLAVRLIYEVDPCNNGERSRRWGSSAPSASAPDSVGPILNAEICTSGEGDAQLVGMRVHSTGNRMDAGSSSMSLHTGGSGTKDAPNYSGATRFLALGVQTGPGELLYMSPTPTRIPSFSGHLVVVQKAAGATGRGELAPSPHTVTGRPIDPCSWIRASGASRGGTTMQEDRTGTGASGDPNTPTNSPLTGTETNTDNNPWVVLRMYQEPIAFTLAA